MTEGLSQEPVAPGTTEEAEGSTNQPDAPQDTAAEGKTNQPTTDSEQVAQLEQTPNVDLAVDPDIEQPSQNPTDVVESDPGAEDEE